jgi:hypothetical protein
MTVEYTFPVPRPSRPSSHKGIPSLWRIPPQDSLLDEPSLRDCHFVERSVLLLGDTDIDVLEQFCKEHPLEIQVLLLVALSLNRSAGSVLQVL